MGDPFPEVRGGLLSHQSVAEGAESGDCPLGGSVWGGCPLCGVINGVKGRVWGASGLVCCVSGVSGAGGGGTVVRGFAAAFLTLVQPAGTQIRFFHPSPHPKGLLVAERREPSLPRSRKPNLGRGEGGVAR